MVLANVVLLEWAVTWANADGAVLEKVCAEEDLHEGDEVFTEGEKVFADGEKGLAKGEKTLAVIESDVTDEGFWMGSFVSHGPRMLMFFGLESIVILEDGCLWADFQAWWRFSPQFSLSATLTLLKELVWEL